MVMSMKDLPLYPQSLVRTAAHKVMRQLRRHVETRPFLYSTKMTFTNSVDNDYEVEGHYDLSFVGRGDGVEVDFILSLYIEEGNNHIAKNVEVRVLPDGGEPIEFSVIITVP